MNQQNTFSSLGLNSNLLDNLDSLGYAHMTPVQALSLPLILSGRDVIAQGKTGSGKTVAFGLGILSKLDAKHFNVQALVLCPTRELADQVAEAIRKLARLMPNVKVMTLSGGVPVRPQANSLENGVHIVVGTPGRVVDHLNRKTLDLQHLQTLVLDEADRMLQMGFEDALDAILGYTPDSRQTLLLSATFPEAIERIAHRVLSKPEKVMVDSSHSADTIDQYFFEISNGAKRLEALRLLLLQHQPASALVFCSTRQDVRDVTAGLQHWGFSVLALHGELEQRERDQMLIQFSNASAMVLVATDVAARGLDINELDVVVNYHMGRNMEDHVHRIGRTGRAGERGVSWSFYDNRDGVKIEKIQQALGHTIKTTNLPPQKVLDQSVPRAPMITLQINGGKKQKIRPGDILGALTAEGGIESAHVGKIKIISNLSYVAVSRESVKAAMKKLSAGKLKGRSCKVRSL